jgi:hypothetical protein
LISSGRNRPRGFVSALAFTTLIFYLLSVLGWVDHSERVMATELLRLSSTNGVAPALQRRGAVGGDLPGAG